VRLRVIGTGSSGNAYILTLDNGKSLLLDAGIPYRQILKTVGADWPHLQAALITHEHNDHASAVGDLTARGMTIYASAGTAGILCNRIDNRWGIVPVRHGASFWTTAGATVTPFTVQHDAEEPLGFVIHDSATGERLAYATDTYYLRYKVPGVHYWIIECNYCEDALTETDPAIRRRLLQSHMSLERLKRLLAANDLTQARKIVLVHLSDARSDEARMTREITELTGVETVAARAGMDIRLKKAPF
jgi:phosphoribosyl 1,2-cyclic phosphodiesterase